MDWDDLLHATVSLLRNCPEVRRVAPVCMYVAG